MEDKIMMQTKFAEESPSGKSMEQDELKIQSKLTTTMQTKFSDTHAHLTDRAFDEDREYIIRKSK